MNDYRPLTSEEIEVLQQNDCWAEDWTSVNVAEDFLPDYMHHVMMYGEVNIGSFIKRTEVSPGFFKHTGIRNATLHQVTIGDDCLIENIGNFINNYTIGDECYISNVSTIETTEGASYGEGNIISVLNEAGEGNLILFSGLSSQLAAFMVRYTQEKDMREALSQMLRKDMQGNFPERGQIGNNVKITNTKEITNCIINDYCEVNGAEHLSDCTLQGDATCSVYVGTGVIAENSIIDYGASITNNANIQDCFIGEACQISNGFTASSSVFFANSIMSNGEACATFCGPFSASHHKSTLLIGGEFSFYNAGSSTNFSNHAYKLGPIHWGTLERGSKTASGSYLFMPAHIGVFSVCLGKTMSHPKTTSLPFSYVIGEGDKTILIPGKNLVTVGLYRDVNKWPKRDLRPMGHRTSLIHFDWLSPFTINEVIKGKEVLQQLINTCGKDCDEYHYQGLVIPGKALKNGITYYNIAIELYLAQVFQKATHNYKESDLTAPTTNIGKGEWDDLMGMYIPRSCEEELLQAIKNEEIDSMEALSDKLDSYASLYDKYLWEHAYQTALDYLQVEEIDEEALTKIQEKAFMAQDCWLLGIQNDAKKEYQLGDMEESTYHQFNSHIQLQREERKKQLGEETK